MANERKSLNIDDVENLVQVQLKEGIETLRSGFKLLIEIMTIFVVANVSILGYAISQTISGIILIGALCPLAIIFIIYGASKFMLPIVYTIVSIEEMYEAHGLDLLGSTFLSVTISSDFIDQLRKIRLIKNNDSRMMALRNLRFRLVDRKSFRIILYVISLSEIICAILLKNCFYWPLF